MKLKINIMNGNYYYYGVLVIGSLLVATALSIVFNRLMKLFIVKYSERLKVDPTNFSFLKNSISFVIFSLAILFIFIKIPYLRSLGAALFAGAGIMVVIVGFASQKAFSNIISGVFILIFKPFRVEDLIEFLDGNRGIVEEITLRHTVIRDFENRRIIIPNGNISEDTIINSTITDAKIRRHITYGISYDSNIDKAVSIIQEESMKHPNFIDNRTDMEKQDSVPPVLVRLVALADFSVQLKSYVWSNSNAESWALQCDVMKSVFERFNKEGIEVPFPYRTIVYKKNIESDKIAS